MEWDYELVASAAKAIGKKVGVWGIGMRYDEHGEEEECYGLSTYGEFVYNPLDRSDEAMALAAALNMQINVGLEDVDAWMDTGENATETWDEHKGDRENAWRRAIVRCAAEVGAKK